MVAIQDGLEVVIQPQSVGFKPLSEDHRSGLSGQKNHIDQLQGPT